MTIKTPEEIRGLEYDWLACDDLNQVALLSTAGGGYVPSNFLANTDEYDHAIDCILGMPVVISTNESIKENLDDIWGRVAERGIYAFDSDSFGGPYRIAGRPLRPALVKDFPVEVAAVFLKIRFTGLRFDMVEEISRGDVVKVDKGTA